MSNAPTYPENGFPPPFASTSRLPPVSAGYGFLATSQPQGYPRMTMHPPQSLHPPTLPNPSPLATSRPLLQPLHHPMAQLPPSSSFGLGTSTSPVGFLTNFVVQSTYRSCLVDSISRFSGFTKSCRRSSLPIDRRISRRCSYHQSIFLRSRRLVNEQGLSVQADSYSSGSCRLARS